MSIPATSFSEITITPAANGFTIKIRGQKSFGVYPDNETAQAAIGAYLSTGNIPWAVKPVVITVPSIGSAVSTTASAIKEA